MNHPVYSKLREDKARLWSFSVASSYENCAHEYYLGRILKLKGKDNIYTQSGSLSHDILETHYEENTPREEMLRLFNIGMMNTKLDGYMFPNDKIERGYMDNMRLYFSSFRTDPNIKECETFVAMPLWIYDKSLIDNYMQGWIDAVLVDEDGVVSLGDFKSSTIFRG
ncbi:MAG: PD-(D/E)XK nuclease family protein, partial [Cetobacterium sp.]